MTRIMLLLNSLRKRQILAFIICLLIVLINCYNFSRKTDPKKGLDVIKVNLPFVIVHIDLKGSPPKLQYLEKLLTIFKNYGANGLLIEYEDMFPYEGDIEALSAVNHYSKHELKHFLSSAVQKGFELIPLIQTFGHMEHALKLPKYKHLREDLLYPDSICPSRLQSKTLIRKMLSQVINLHQSIAPLKHIHIGCDEVYVIKKCDVCRKVQWSNSTIYLNHVEMVTSMVDYLIPGVKVLIWDDMLRSIVHTEPNLFQRVSLKNVEPVYWEYRPNVRVRHYSLYNYHRKFQNIWIASAFKGADGNTATFPNEKHRFQNHFNWMNLIAGFKFGGEKQLFDFKGIILTGWSRYSHMDPLCELLPVAIPSLVMNLLVIQKFKKGASKTWNWLEFYNRSIKYQLTKELLCEETIDLEDFKVSSCNFDSIELYNTLQVYLTVSDNLMRSLLNDRSWLSSIEYYAKQDSLNMNSVARNIMWCDSAMDDLKLLHSTITRAMGPYFERHSIEEYVGFKLQYPAVRLRNTMKYLREYMQIKTWNRRGERNFIENQQTNLSVKVDNKLL